MKKISFAVLFFLAVSIAMTFPLVLRLDKSIPGFFSTDEPFGVIWHYWAVKECLKSSFSLEPVLMISYPFGLPLYPAGSIPTLLKLADHFLLLFISPVFFFNLQIFLNFILCGLFCYLLVFYLTKDFKSSLFSGLIFAFSPYQFARTWQHLGLTYNQWIPLLLFSAILLRENISRKNIFLFLAAIILTFSFDYSITYFSVFTMTVFLAYLLLKGRRKEFYPQSNREYFRRVLITGALAVILLFPYILPIIIKRFVVSPNSLPSAFNIYHRPFEDLFSQSARPLSYFLPSAMHPVFGRFTEQFVGSFLYGVSFTEHTLYLGLIPLILAFSAFKKRRQQNREGFYIGFFVFLAAAAWFFSQPPWWKIGALKIYMPSFFMYKILPMYRAYCRFGVVLIFAVAVLAGFGLKFFLAKFKSARAKSGIAGLCFLLVLFEFWSYPPFKVIDLSAAAEAYRWLKEQPQDKVIAQYPLDSQVANPAYLFSQTQHGKKMINATAQGTYANRIANSITKLSEFRTAGVLKWLGVKYVLVHRRKYLDTEMIPEIEELKNIPANPGLKLVRSFTQQDCPDRQVMCVRNIGPVDVYEVVAKDPLDPKVQ